MTPLPHVYEVALAGDPAGYATLSGPNLPEVRTAPPADFGGPGDAWSPEHFLLSAVATCFLFTLRAVAQASRIEFLKLEMRAEGTVDKEQGVTRFTAVTLRPRLTVPASVDPEKAKRYLALPNVVCVGGSWVAPVHVGLPFSPYNSGVAPDRDEVRCTDGGSGCFTIPVPIARRTPHRTDEPRPVPRLQAALTRFDEKSENCHGLTQLAGALLARQ